MNRDPESDNKITVASSTGDRSDLWPSDRYDDHVHRLRKAIGKIIFIEEIVITEINSAIGSSDHGYELLAIIDFPKPDPETGLYPHGILLDDGRGINLGRIARISIEQAFSPDSQNILYEDRQLIDRLLPGNQRGSRDSIRKTSRMLLGGILGKHTIKPLSAFGKKRNN